MQPAQARQLRRSCEDLVVSGRGIMAFGAWSFIRFFAQAFLDRQTIIERLGLADLEEKYVWLVLVVFILVFCCLGVGIHLFVGLSARAEARDGKPRIAYLVVAAIIAHYYLSRDVDRIRGMLDGTYQSGKYMSLLIDLSLLYVLFDLFRSSIQVKRLRKRLKEAAQDHDRDMTAAGES